MTAALHGVLIAGTAPAFATGRRTEGAGIYLAGATLLACAVTCSRLFESRRAVYVARATLLVAVPLVLVLALAGAPLWLLPSLLGAVQTELCMACYLDVRALINSVASTRA